MVYFDFFFFLNQVKEHNTKKIIMRLILLQLPFNDYINIKLTN